MTLAIAAFFPNTLLRVRHTHPFWQVVRGRHLTRLHIAHKRCQCLRRAIYPILETFEEAGVQLINGPRAEPAPLCPKSTDPVAFCPDDAQACQQYNSDAFGAFTPVRCQQSL